MAPREDGSYLVPSQFVEMWKDQSDGGGRDQIKQLWNQVGGDKEAFKATAKKRVESVQESDLWVDGKFMSEKNMVEEGFEPKDRYEKHVNVYWVEEQMVAALTN
ncbi:Uncharacterized protein SCF082_LOCUS45835 [Durusdinium trenchii]|uniref:Uncharacterized protein n=1 Tax=Durusdinium trenchii TaxID=1381693 RepID=A0ABP0RD68_9DINO